MHDPKVTVLMPAYNAGKYIYEAIASVLKQSFTDFELVIVNDGSTDDTLKIISSFADERITVLNQPNKGIATALNNGLAHASAPYIARFDADDICYSERLQVQYDFIMLNPNYTIIGSAVDYTDVYGDYIFTHTPKQPTALSYKECPFIHSSVFYKKDDIINAGGYNEHAYTFEDHFLWANILKTHSGFNLSQPLIKVRLNPESITIDEKWRTGKFRKIKCETISRLAITQEEGEQLLAIGIRQLSPRIKQGAYYALLGKKYLWNSYHPQKARKNLMRTLSISPFHVKNYFLLLMSFLPEKALSLIYRTIKDNSTPTETSIATETIKHKELNYGS